MFRRFLPLCLIATCVSAPFARGATASGVQTLGNFAALQKIASNQQATRDFVSRVAEAYVKAGYNDFGPEFRRSAADLIAPYDGDDHERKAARGALRRLQSALAKDAFVKLPANDGESLPDYHGLAVAFLQNAKVALKNLAAGKNVATSLRNKKLPLWITNDGGNHFTLSSSLGTVGNFSVAGTGSLSGTLNAVTFNAGTLDVNVGSFVGLQAVQLSGTTFTVGLVKIGSGSGMLIGPGTTLGNSTLNLSGGALEIGETDGIEWLVFLPDAEIPEALSDTFTILLQIPYTVNEADYPAGTKILKAPSDTEAPTAAFVISSSKLTAVPTASPTPTPAPAE